MPASAASKTSKPAKRAPSLWEEAYKALRDDDQGADRLRKLTKRLQEETGQTKLDLRHKDSYKHLLALINAKSAKLPMNSSSPVIANICNNMMRIKDIVGAGVSAGGPYAALPAAGLFIVFSTQEVYQDEKETMLLLAENVTHYTVLAAKCRDLVKSAAADDEDMRNLKETLRIVCVGLYKAILFTSAQLADFAYSEWKRTKLLLGTYGWKDQLDDLDRYFGLYVHYRNEMDSRRKKPATAPKKNLKKEMGPGPRNPLHWAVALVVPERVNELVSKKEFPINALTTKSWTAAHLAARHGNTKIMKTLLTADGINLTIKNQEHGRTPLHVAAVNNKVGALKLLLQREPKLLQMRDDMGRTAFLLAARKNYVKVLDVLKQHGQDLNEATGKNGWTALHVAAEYGHVKTVQWLLSKGAKKDLKTKDGAWKGITAKQVAERKGKTEVVELL